MTAYDAVLSAQPPQRSMNSASAPPPCHTDSAPSHAIPPPTRQHSLPPIPPTHHNDAARAQHLFPHRPATVLQKPDNITNSTSTAIAIKINPNHPCWRFLHSLPHASPGCDGGGEGSFSPPFPPVSPPTALSQMGDDRLWPSARRPRSTKLDMDTLSLRFRRQLSPRSIVPRRHPAHKPARNSRAPIQVSDILYMPIFCPLFASKSA